MARINVEDSLFKDPRFMDLIAKIGRDAALGAAVQAFIIAQEFFLNENTKRMIPLADWKKRRLNDLIIETGLAEIRDGDLVYVCESEIHFAWLLQCQQAAQRSAQKRKATNPQRPSTNPDEPSTTVEAPSTSYSYSPSPSSSKINNINISAGEKAKRVMEAIRTVPRGEPDRLKRLVGENLFQEVLDRGGWEQFRTIKRDQFTMMNAQRVFQ